MKLVKTKLLIASALIILLGIIWMGQGLGYIRYPATSFMIDQSPWIWRGGLVAVLGLIGVVVSRRI